MTGLAVEAHAVCGACNARIHLDAMVSRLTCAGCGKALCLEPELWQSLVGSKIAKALTLAEGFGEKSSLYTGGVMFHAVVARQTPTYRDTKEAIAPDAITEGSAKGFLLNPANSRPVVVREPPEELRHLLPGVTHLVGEDLALISAQETHKGRFKALKPLKNDAKRCSCPQCGGSIDLPASERLVLCPFCATPSFIADALWRDLHPECNPLRWYLYFEGLDLSEGEAPEVRYYGKIPQYVTALGPMRHELPPRRSWCAIRMEISCDACSEKIPFRAMVPELPCDHCGQVTSFTPERYYHMLQEEFRSMDTYEEGETNEGFRMGVTSFSLTYGRLTPTYPGTGAPIPLHEVHKGAADGVIVDPETHKKLVVRTCPEHLTHAFPALEYIVGEDPHWLPRTAETSPFSSKPAKEPLPMVCTECGGTIEVDGTAQAVPCPYCAHVVPLPHDVWLRLHASRKPKWLYFLNNNAFFPIALSSVTGVAGTAGGGLFVLGGLTLHDGYGLCSLDEHYRPLWVHEGIEAELPGLDDGVRYRITPVSDRELLLWPFDEPSPAPIVRFTWDGEGQLETLFSLSHVRSLDRDDDGTLMILLKPEERPKDAPAPLELELARYDLTGTRHPLWPKGRKPSVWSRLGRLALDMIGDYPSLQERMAKTPSWFQYTGGMETRFTRGDDGRFYLLYETHLIVFSRDGERLFAVELPLHDTLGMLCADQEGSVYIMGKRKESRNYGLLKLDPNGKERFYREPDSDDHDIHYDSFMAVAGARLCIISESGTFITYNAQGELLLHTADTYH